MAVAQGRVGVYLAVKALIRPGQKVVLSPYTIADVINMVICAGGVPVFADIDRPTTNVRTDTIRDLLDADTGAVMVTHLHGIACDIDGIAALCRERGIPLIEDAAQAFGARVHGKPVGTFGDVGIFSVCFWRRSRRLPSRTCRRCRCFSAPWCSGSSGSAICGTSRPSGFAPVGVSRRLGTNFQVFVKSAFPI